MRRSIRLCKEQKLDKKGILTRRDNYNESKINEGRGRGEAGTLGKVKGNILGRAVALQECNDLVELRKDIIEKIRIIM